MKKQAKYETIYQNLRQKILCGGFPDGRLPSLAELTKSYNASLLTVNNAVKKLAEEGLVSRGAGRSGTKITQPGLRQMSLRKKTMNTWNDCLEFSFSRPVTLRYLSDRRSIFLPKEMNEIIKEFEHRYPWIRIVQDFTDDVDFLKVSDHDLIQGSHSTLLPLIRNQKLLNLEPYFQAFGRVNSILHDNYTAPLMMTLPLMFYRKKEFSKIPVNWTEYFLMNSKLKQDGKYSGSLLGFVSLLYFFIGNIRENLFNPEKEPQLRQAIQLLYEYYTWKAPWTMLSPGSVIDAAMKDNISLVLGYYSNLYNKMKFDFDYDLLPYPGKYLIETIRIGVNASSLHPSESWLFLNFLRSEYVQKKVVKNSFGIPYRESVFHKEFREATPKLYERMLPLLDRLEESYVSEEGRNRIYHVIYPLLEQYFAREFTMDECVASLRTAMNEQLILDDITNKS